MQHASMWSAWAGFLNLWALIPSYMSPLGHCLVPRPCRLPLSISPLYWLPDQKLLTPCRDISVYTSSHRVSELSLESREVHYKSSGPEMAGAGECVTWKPLIESHESVAVRLSCCVHARAQALAWSGASALTTSDFLKLAATPSTRFFSLKERFIVSCQPKKCSPKWHSSSPAQSLARPHQHLHDRRLAAVNFRCHGTLFKSNTQARTRDNGIGLRCALEHIVLRWAQENMAGNTRADSGSGLGLWGPRSTPPGYGTLAVNAKDIRGGTPCVPRGDVATLYCGRNAIAIHVTLALCMPVLLVGVLWIHAAVHVQAAVNRHKRRVLQARAYRATLAPPKKLGSMSLGVMLECWFMAM